MPTTSKPSSPRPAPSTSTRPLRPNYPGSFRKTRTITNGVALNPPYVVDLTPARAENLVHAFGRVDGCVEWRSCCHLTYVGVTRAAGEVVTCMKCILCRGCFACTPGHIREETMFMGKWETKDGRVLYPFEMDSQHLMNSIAKLYRDKSHFKQDWNEWITCLEAEAKLRHLF